MAYLGQITISINGAAKMTIPLGSIVRDKVTGLKGVAENRATFLYGCDRYCVQPRAKEDGSVPESIMVDEPQLEMVKDEERVMFPAGEPVQTIELGSVVEDPVRGDCGTATGRAVYLNGCSRILVEPKQIAGQKYDIWWAPEQQLRVKKSFLGSEKKTFEVDTAFRATGGPARSSSKY